MGNSDPHIVEAEQIGYYLLDISVNDAEKKTYAEAMQKLNISLSEYERLLWQNMMKSRSRMAYIDAGLAYKEPNNNARRKLFTMLAILEASPRYTSYFLSRKFSGLYIFKIGLVGMRAVFRAVIGVVIINNIKRKCS